MAKNKQVIEVFDSVGAFVQTVNGRPNNGAFDDISLTAGRVDFFGCKSYDDANRLALYGWDTGVSAIQGLQAATAGGNAKFRPSYDMAGGVPNIPRAISGNPMCWRRMRRNTPAVRVLTLAYSVNANYTKTANTLAAVAAVVLDAVAGLEKSGYRLNIYAGAVVQQSRGNESFAACWVKVKEAGQYLQISRVAYPLAHPAFFRRHLFRWRETHPKTGFINRNRRHGFSPRDSRIYAAAAAAVNADVVLNAETLCGKSREEITSEIRKQIAQPLQRL